MDGLRPDSDEVDSFQQSRNPRAIKKQVASSRVSPKSVATKKTDPKNREPRQSGELKPAAARRSASSTLIGLIMIVFMVGAVGGGWIYNEQRQELVALNSELKDALGFIRQGKLLMARFEGKLSETDAEMTSGDSEAQKKLKFLDSEVRKLWGVAYDRNRKAIGANDGLIKQHALELKNAASELKKISAVNKKQAEKLNDLVKVISLQQSSTQVLQSDLLAIKGSNEQLSSQIKQVEDASSAVVLAMRQEIDRLTESEGVGIRVQKNEVAIEAIDASRLQLNERFIVLDRKLNDLQLSIKSLQSGGEK